MSKKYTGHCACDQLAYGFDTEPTFVANCHCTDCKRASGGEMATIASVPDTDFTVFSGNPKSFSYGPNTEKCAGKGLDRVFCANCDSRVASNNLKDCPGYVFVQEGTRDRLDEWFAPKAEIFYVESREVDAAAQPPTIRPRAQLNGSHARVRNSRSRDKEYR
jgi:hypothetical protein